MRRWHTTVTAKVSTGGRGSDAGAVHPPCHEPSSSVPEEAQLIIRVLIDITRHSRCLNTGWASQGWKSGGTEDHLERPRVNQGFPLPNPGGTLVIREAGGGWREGTCWSSRSSSKQFLGDRDITMSTSSSCVSRGGNDKKERGLGQEGRPT